MLTKLDDTLLHQAPTTFDHAVTSDHRFYDRYWFQAIEPGGATSLVAGMGLYKNTNVLDGFCTVVYDGMQYCLRVSRGAAAGRRRHERRRAVRRRGRRAPPVAHRDRARAPSDRL